MIKIQFVAALICSAVVISYSASGQEAKSDTSVITYDKEYFIKYDPLTLLDMLQRVPGVQTILDSNRRQGGGGTSSGGQQEHPHGGHLHRHQ